jgi:hypothetical protein
VLQELLDDIYDDFSSFSEIDDSIDKKVTTFCKKCDVYIRVWIFLWTIIKMKNNQANNKHYLSSDYFKF